MEKRSDGWYFAVSKWTDKDLLRDYCEQLNMDLPAIELCEYLFDAAPDDKKDFLQAHRVMLLKLRKGSIDRLNGGNVYGQY